LWRRAQCRPSWREAALVRARGATAAARLARRSARAAQLGALHVHEELVLASLWSVRPDCYGNSQKRGRTRGTRRASRRLIVSFPISGLGASLQPLVSKGACFRRTQTDEVMPTGLQPRASDSAILGVVPPHPPPSTPEDHPSLHDVVLTVFPAVPLLCQLISPCAS
jgi:hypothetical protein